MVTHCMLSSLAQGFFVCFFYVARRSWTVSAMLKSGVLSAELFETAMGVILEYMFTCDVGRIWCVCTSGAGCCRRYLESIGNGELKYRKNTTLHFNHQDYDRYMDADHFVRINADQRMLQYHGAEETVAYIVRQLYLDVGGNAIKSSEVAAFVYRKLLSVERQLFYPTEMVGCWGDIEIAGVERVRGEDDDWRIMAYERLMLAPREALRYLSDVMYPDEHRNFDSRFAEQLRLTSGSLSKVMLETGALLMYTRDPVEYMFCNFMVRRAHDEVGDFLTITRRFLKFRHRNGSYHLVEQYTRYSPWEIRYIPESSEESFLMGSEDGDESANS